MKRLAIITTHPIQYYAPIFELLAQRQRLNLKVFYTAGKPKGDVYDQGFQRNIQWDIPLTQGYIFEWMQNTATQPGSHHFKGIINPELFARISDYHPDAILVFGWAYDSHLKALRHFKGKVPVLFRGDSTLLDEKAGLKSILRSLFLKWVYRHVDKALYTGTQNKAYYNKFGLDNRQLCFAPHAVDNERFSQTRNAEVNALRTRLNINADEILILFAGKLEVKKNPSLLLDAFMQLQRSNCYLLFTGNGMLQQELQHKAANHPRVRFMDFQNQSYMPVIYQACDLFCLSSQGPGETWGLAVNEAMACSKAILVSDKVGCAVDLVKENINGAIFKSNNLPELLACLHKLTASKELLVTYGLNSYELIREWNFKHIAEAIENTVPEKTIQTE